MAEIMHREYEKATEVERRKEEERWKQSLSYQEQLEKQLEEQVKLIKNKVSVDPPLIQS